MIFTIYNNLLPDFRVLGLSNEEIEMLEKLMAHSSLLHHKYYMQPTTMQEEDESEEEGVSFFLYI
jgi:hypothetical protein